MGYVKLFTSIIHSTIWREPDHVRIVWVTMLAMSDQYGIVECSVPGLADAARVNLQQCESALDRLQAPDEYSRNPENEGRRISKIEGGFEILNYESYRRKMSEEDRKEKNAAKQRAWRARQKSKLEGETINSVTGSVTDRNQALPSVTDRNQALPNVTHSDQNRSEQIRTDQIRTDKDKTNGHMDIPPTGGPKPKRKTTLPPVWHPNEAYAVLSRSLGVDLSVQTDAFRDYEAAHRRTMADWDATFRMWLRKSAEYRQKRVSVSTRMTPQQQSLDALQKWAEEDDNTGTDTRLFGDISDRLSRAVPVGRNDGVGMAKTDKRS